MSLNFQKPCFNSISVWKSGITRTSCEKNISQNIDPLAKGLKS